MFRQGENVGTYTQPTFEVVWVYMEVEVDLTVVLYLTERGISSRIQVLFFNFIVIVIVIVIIILIFEIINHR